MYSDDYKLRFAENFIRFTDMALILIIFTALRNYEQIKILVNMENILDLKLSLRDFIFFFISAFLWNRIFTVMHMYKRISEGWISRISRVFTASSIGTAAILLCEKIIGTTISPGRSAFILYISVICVFILYRELVFRVFRKITQSRKPLNVVIVGRNKRSISLYEEIKTTRPDYKLLGFIDNTPEDKSIKDADSKSKPRLLCSLLEFNRYISNVRLDEVIISLPMRSYYDEIEKIIKICSAHGVKTRLMNDFFNFHIDMERNYSNSFIDYHVGGSYELQYDLKRIFDIMISLAALLILMPVFLITSLAVFIDDGLPVFFIRERIGLNKKNFKRIKFRSMIRGSDKIRAALEQLDKSDTFRIKEDINLTRIGKFLRKTGIEQMPQLLNVLSGSMSIVGPKPLSIKKFNFFYKDIYSRRFNFRPGIIGIWQVSGRNENDFEELINLDLQYINKWNLIWDFKIIFTYIYIKCLKLGTRAYEKLPESPVFEQSEDDEKND